MTDRLVLEPFSIDKAQQSEAHMGVLELLKSRALLMPLGIGIVMQLSQQLSGKTCPLLISPLILTL